MAAMHQVPDCCRCCSPVSRLNLLRVVPELLGALDIGSTSLWYRNIKTTYWI
jgi:hypothetical protein